VWLQRVVEKGGSLVLCTDLVPLKRYDPGDGMFFQWVVCAAIWSTAKVGDLVLGCPRVPPLAMLGGVAWATGLCVLLSGSSSLLMGWASSRFGWFGVNPEEVPSPVLNYCGAGLCLLSGVIFFFVKTNVEIQPLSEESPLLMNRRTGCGAEVQKVGPTARRIIACLLAVAQGLLYGSTFTPVLYIKDHALVNGSGYHGASQRDVDYLYTLCSGIFLTNTVYLILYCCLKGNRPQVLPRVILPALMCGVMWTIASYCWFLANYFLSAVIAYPIVSAGYGLVAALWGCLVFKEVKGLANLLVFSLGSLVVLAGSLLTAISKI
ncbi:hypothetical protein NHX12_011687, partial [Muraenolepis orangiensis]